MKVGKLFYEDEDGERHLLGERKFPLTDKRGDIMQGLLEEFWDSRLDSASCRPVVQIDEVDPTT